MGTLFHNILRAAASAMEIPAVICLPAAVGVFRVFTGLVAGGAAGRAAAYERQSAPAAGDRAKRRKAPAGLHRRERPAAAAEGGTMKRLGGKRRDRFDGENVDPMSYLSNLSNVMLILAARIWKSGVRCTMMPRPAPITSSPMRRGTDPWRS